MAAGLPIVASRVGGIPELVRHGRTGLLAESEQPESLAAALYELLSDRGRMQTMGESARQVALAEYSRDLYTRRHLELYQTLLRN
jgi:glycosyltransferase involved in cell wall biosynthesis